MNTCVGSLSSISSSSADVAAITACWIKDVDAHACQVDVREVSVGLQADEGMLPDTCTLSKPIYCGLLKLH